MDCSFCEDKQYCQDCNCQEELHVEDDDQDEIPGAGKAQSTILIQGDTIYHNGYPRGIVGIKQGNPNLRVYTKEVVFYLRQIGERYILIKMERLPEKRK